ncbi:MAG: hypothetical protein KJO98_04155, partial [Rhodothermia bacterium]|nr:hypothetical protein [Rhodothermia bacterium]
MAGLGTITVLFTTFALAGCDIPSQGPDFSFNSDVSTPVIFDQSFVFLGTDAQGVQALIDTTKSDYDSLFAVDAQTDAVYLVHDIDAFELNDLEDLVDPVAISPQDVSVNMGDLATQDVSTDFDRSIGVVEIAPVSTPPVPADVSSGQAYFPLSAGDFLTIPPTSFIDLSSADVESVDVTGETQSVNLISFEVTNQSGDYFTNGSGTPGSPPEIILESITGQEIVRGVFDRSPGPGENASANVGLSGLTIPADARFRLDVSTPSGFGIIQSDPNALRVQGDMLPVRYDGFTLSNIPESTVDASQSSVDLSAEVDFTGITTRDGDAVLRVHNTLPVPVNLSDLRVLNDQGVDVFPPGHTVFSAGGRIVPANSTIDVPVQLGRTAISSTVSVDATATAEASAPSTQFQSTDGLDIEVTGTIDVDRLYFLPNGESFTSSGTIDIDASDFQFQTGSDFVEFADGILELRQLLNGLDLSFDEVVLSYPEVRTAPYGPGDSLVIRFRGTTDKAEQLQFHAIERNEPARDLSVGLAGTRAYAIGNVIRYNVTATGETSTQERVIDYSDEVSTEVQAVGLTVAAAAGYVDPFSTSLNTDLNDDGRIDPLIDGEAIISELGGLGPLDDLSGLQLSGTELAINITTSLAADLSIYGLLVGEDESGNLSFLQGRGVSSVAVGDSMISAFEIGGSAPRPDQMFKIAMSTSGSAAQPTTHSVILDDGNSNINEFLSAMPSRLRFVGKAVVEAQNGRIELRQPVALDISLGATVPLNISDSFSLQKTLGADLSSLESLSDPEATFTAERATVVLSYTNGIPLGVDAR